MKPIRSKARVPSRRQSSGARTACCAAAPLLALAAAPLLALAATVALARPVPVPAEPEPMEPTPTAVTAQRSGVSLEEAIERASRRYPGTLVRAETKASNGRRVHEIRILVEGEGDPRMLIVRIDAETGRFL